MSSIERIAFLAKLASARPGLWANIRAKKKRGETTAKPGDEDYPDSKNWDKVTAIAEKQAQCWEGYERVPGTTALTPGSCRPAGKKKKKEAEKQSGAAWQTAEGKNPDGGLNDKGRASLKAQGHDIKRPQPEGGARKDSFCARMGGMKAKLTSAETANDPDSRINKALRKWKCGSDIATLAKQAAYRDKAAMASVYSPQQPQQPQQQWMQPQQPIFVINSAPSQSGIMTGLGNLTAAGGGIAGAGSLAVNYGANKGIPAFKRYDQFEPNLLHRVDQFNTKMNSPTLNAAEKLKAYVEHGTDLIQQPVWTKPDGSKMIGRDVIEKVYNHPITTMIADGSQPNMKWSPSLSEHYGQFNKGPAAAYAQLGAELLKEAPNLSLYERQLALHTAAHNKHNTSRLGQLAARNDAAKAVAEANRAAIAGNMDTMQGRVTSKVDNFIERLRGKGLLGKDEDAWASKFRERLQLRHDKMKAFREAALAPQDEILNKLKGRGGFIQNKINISNLSGDALKTHLTALADASKERIVNSIPVLPGDQYGITRNAMKDELLQLAKSKPEFAGSLGRGLESLSRDQQLKLVDYAHRTPLGQSLANSFGDPTSLAFRTNSYGNLSNAIAAPKRILDWGVSNLGRLAAKSRIGAMLSLPVVGSGLAMRYLGGSQDAANSEAATQGMVDKIRKALNSNVLPALTPEATPYASLPNSGILPSLIGKPYIGKQSSDYIAALAKQAAAQAGGSYLNRVVASHEQDIARMQDQAARVRAASGIPNPTGNGTHSWGGHVFPDRVENPTYNFTPPESTPPPPTYTGLGSQELNGRLGLKPYPLLKTTPTQTGQASTPSGVTPSAHNPFLPDFLQSTQPGQAPTSSSVGKDKAPQLQNATGNVGNDTNQKPFSQGGFFGSNFEPQDLPVSDSAQPNPAAAEESPFANFDPNRPGYLTPEQSMLANYSSSLLNGAQDGGMGNILTAASTYDSATEKERNGKTFRRGDLQTRPGPTNVVRTNINAGTGQYDQKSDAYGNSRPSATSGSFRTATPKPVSKWKPIDISGDRRRKETEMGWAPNSMDQGGERYGENGPRSKELAKNPKPISDTYVAPPGEDPQHTALNKAMFDIKKEQRVALASGKTWSPSGVNIINPVKPTAMAQAPAPKAPSNTYATSRFSSTPPSWMDQIR